MCHDDKLELTCPLQSQIQIIDANYGRLNYDVCSTGIPAEYRQNTNCISSQALDVVRNLCEGKSQCSVTVDLALNGGVEPCFGTFKYATVDYKCLSSK